MNKIDTWFEKKIFKLKTKLVIYRNVLGNKNIADHDLIGIILELIYSNTIVIEEFYIDDNEQLQVISLSLMFYVGYTKYGFFGDEGRGFSLSRRDIKDVGGDSVFYLEDLEK